MKRLRAVALWLFWRFGFGLLLYMALAHGSDGAANFAKFYVWMVAVLLLLVAIGMLADIDLSNKPSVIPLWLNVAVDTVAFCVMLWFGWIATAAAYLFSIVIAAAAQRRMGAKE